MEDTYILPGEEIDISDGSDSEERLKWISSRDFNALYTDIRRQQDGVLFCSGLLPDSSDDEDFDDYVSELSEIDSPIPPGSPPPRIFDDEVLLVIESEEDQMQQQKDDLDILEIWIEQTLEKSQEVLDQIENDTQQQQKSSKRQKTARKTELDRLVEFNCNMSRIWC